MPFFVVRNDITKMKVDAVVNAANETLLGGGGVDGAIHAAAGPGLLAECRTLGGCRTGEAKRTGGYNMPCRYIIHTVGPVWHGGNRGEEQALRSCYTSSLMLAAESDCETTAFPLISSGVYGYPKEKAYRAAEDAIRAFLEDHDMTVYLVLFDAASFTVGEALAADIRSYIDDRYAEAHAGLNRYYGQNRVTSDILPSEKPQALHSLASEAVFQEASLKAPRVPGGASSAEAQKPAKKEKAGFLRKKNRKESKADGIAASEILCDSALSLEDLVHQIDESFSEMLLRKIDEKGMTDAACYKKANIDRKLFSKIRSDRFYKPSKATVLCFAIALELSPEETADMLMKAGFALSHSNVFDIIVEYFITNRIYDIIEINDTLFSYDQPLLGM